MTSLLRVLSTSAKEASEVQDVNDDAESLRKTAGATGGGSCDRWPAAIEDWLDLKDEGGAG
jgi:hypothetical protein